MSNNDLSDYAGIVHDGSIGIGKNTVVDGSITGREIGVFSHIHSDHTMMFTQAKHECTAIFVSRPTFDLLGVLEQNDEEHPNLSAEAYFRGRHIHPLDFNTPIVPKMFLRKIDPGNKFSDKITLLEANHILGSAQVLVNTNDNKSILYSSDFSYGTEPVKCDVLILDATHGDPRFNAVIDGDSLENTLCRLVEEYIESGTPITIRAHVGRLQYTMSVLSQSIDSDIIFLASKKNSRLAKVYQKWGMPIRNLMDDDLYEAEEIIGGNYPFIEFKTEQARPSDVEMSDKSAVFTLGGHHLGNKTVIQQLCDPQTKQLTNKFRLEFGDHGNYDGILEYVDKCEPTLVVTDNYRSAWGEKLADKITTELKIKAISQPASTNPSV